MSVRGSTGPSPPPGRGSDRTTPVLGSDMGELPRAKFDVNHVSGNPRNNDHIPQRFLGTEATVGGPGG
jgi:hypothetical protein